AAAVACLDRAESLRCNRRRSREAHRGSCRRHLHEVSVRRLRRPVALFAAARTAQDLPVGAPFGLSLIFLNVLLEQLGLPVPAVPTLVIAGALAANGRLPASGVFALAVAACLIGDSSWYLAGRRYGARVMKLLCRISLTPDTCVSQTQASFERWGPRALVVA